MNRMSIMAAIVALLLIPVLSSPAAAYHSRHTRHHFSSHHKHFYPRLSRYRSDECVLTNSGRRVCNATYQTPVVDALFGRLAIEHLPWQMQRQLSARGQAVARIPIAVVDLENISD